MLIIASWLFGVSYFISFSFNSLIKRVARTLLPAALASVSFGFVLVRV